MRIDQVLLGVALTCAGMAGAQTAEPALGWLSDSVTPRVDASPRPRSAPAQVAVNALPAPVTVAPLGAPDLNRIGVFAPERAGLDRELWGASEAATLVRLLLRDRTGALPAARELFSDILLAELDPPRRGADKSLFLARPMLRVYSAWPVAAIGTRRR
ncbi:hypothetical protein LCGC14_2949470 [marine sediment metagenome]|uniref:Uncharacterized protein n=1 Tax=marine sediment metagenome TaxID=412755 RepID=A0A0F8XGB2_9ZZZZ